MKVLTFEEAINILDVICRKYIEGALIILPTDTRYGLTALYNNAGAVEKIYKLKNRGRKKPFIHLVSSFEMAERIAEIGKDENSLLKKYWPGPVTFILKCRTDAGVISYGENPNGPTGSGSESIRTIAIRFPENELLMKVINGIGSPIVAPSANISDGEIIKSERDVYDHFNDNIDIMIKKDDYDQTPASTIIDLTGKETVLLREGTVKVEI